jgi:hypothetical protein
MGLQSIKETVPNGIEDQFVEFFKKQSHLQDLFYFNWTRPLFFKPSFADMLAVTPLLTQRHSMLPVESNTWSVLAARTRMPFPTVQSLLSRSLEHSKMTNCRSFKSQV